MKLKTKTRKLAESYSKANFKVARGNKNVVEYNGDSGSKYSLTFNNTRKYHLAFGCTCSFFHPHGIGNLFIFLPMVQLK